MLIDTLRPKKRLTDEFGMDERHAEGIVAVLSSAEEQLATSADLDGVRLEIREVRQDVENLRVEFDTRFEARLTRKMYGVRFLIITVLGALNFFT